MHDWNVVWVPDPGRWGSLSSEGVLGVQDLSAEVAHLALAGAALTDRLRQAEEAALLPDNVVRLPRS